ncbi:MAG TPA: hypothetical protein VNH11_03660 [Pirellulales bacterium]|nr:hypothetical protein [Pirellulales bacterium]
MSSAGHVPGGPRRSWRDAQAATGDPRVRRQVRRVFWSLLGAGLLACFAWAVFWMVGPQPVTYLAAAAVTDYDVLAAPPLAFARQSLEGLKSIASVRFLPGGEGATSADQLNAWLESLKTQKLREQDVLIVYLAAHGVSANQAQSAATAYLLGSDYYPPDGKTTAVGLVDLGAVFEAIAACGAKTKLLVLDAGSLDHDLALGMVLNEFPQLLAEKNRQFVKEQAGRDRGLWVLASHDLFEKSHAAHADADPRCVFSHFVAQGLAGKADKNDNGVDLAELYQYVREGVGRYVWQASGGRETQTPQLLGPAADGERVVAEAANVLLVGRTKRAVPAPTKGDAEPSEAPTPKVDEPKATTTRRAREANRSRFLARASGLYGTMNLPHAAGNDTFAVAGAELAAIDLQLPKVAAGQRCPGGDATGASAGRGVFDHSRPLRGQPLPQPPKVSDVTYGGPAIASALFPPYGYGVVFNLVAAEAPAPDKTAKAEGDAAAATPAVAEPDGDKKPPQAAAPAANDNDHATAESPDTVAKPLSQDEDTAGGKKNDDPFLASLAEQWLLCHELVDRAAHDWTAIDYAPHRWLQSVEKLKGYELRWLCGVSNDPRQLSGLSGDLHEERRKLNRYASDLPLALVRAQQHPQLQTAVRLRNDLLLRLRYYIESPLVLGADVGNIDALLDGLPRLLALLRSQPDATGQAIDARTWLADLEAACSKLQAPMNALEASFAERFAERFDRGDPATIEAVLEFPWIEAERRIALLETLKASLPLSDKPTDDEIVPRPPAWKRTAQFAGWQAKWLQLVGGQSAVVNKLLSGLSGASSDQTELRTIGAQVASLRGALIAGLNDDGDAAKRSDAANRLRLLDARANIPADMESDLILRDRLPELNLPWNLKLVRLNKKAPVELAADDAVQVQWRIEADPPRPVRARWKVADYKQSQLLIEPTHGELELTDDREQMLAVKVRAAKGFESTARLTLEIETEGRTDRDTIDVRVRPLEPIRLVVEAPGPEGMHEIVEDDPRRRILRPLASGQTTFHVSLHNPSRRPREIEYRLLAYTDAGIVPPDLLGRLPGVEDELPGGFKVLQAKTLKLEADEKKPLPLAEPAKPAAKEAAGPAGADAPPAGPPKGQPIAALVCEVQDAAPGGQPLVQRFWISLEPLHPRRYLTPTARFDFDKRLIELDFAPLDAGWLPPEGSAIDWQYGKGTLAPPGRLLGASIIPPKDLDDRPVEVFVSADHYPRAFRYDIRCDGPRGTQLPKDDFDLRLIGPPAGQQNWLRKGEPARVKLAADFPKDRLRGRGNLVRIEIDAETGQTQRRVELHADRQAKFLLLPAAADGLLAIEAAVGDIEVGFPTDAYQDQELQVVATLGNLRPVSCSFTLDTKPPTIEVDRLPTAVVGQELHVVLRATDERGAVKKVEVALDPNDSGEWKMPVLAQPAAAGGNVWEASLPTNDKTFYPAGRVSQFLARATDEAGNTPERPQRFEFRVVPAPPKPAGGDQKANLSVTVLFQGVPADRINVTVSGPKSWQGKTDAKGQFTLQALPAGVYKFHLQGYGRAGTPLDSEHELKFDPAVAPVQKETLVGKSLRRP